MFKRRIRVIIPVKPRSKYIPPTGIGHDRQGLAPTIGCDHGQARFSIGLVGIVQAVGVVIYKNHPAQPRCAIGGRGVINGGLSGYGYG